jgi:uncharacterized membrane protein
MDDIARAFEWIGVAIIVVAFVMSVASAGRRLAAGSPPNDVYRAGRAFFGRGILLALEALVAADLIRTVAVQPTLENVAVLGLIVLVRTFLSFALDAEVDGRLPWQQRAG